MSDESRLVFSTCATAEDAERLAQALVERHLAACVSIGSPVTSVFPWEGTIKVEREVPLTIKTHVSRIAELKAVLVELHPYDVPEMLVVPVTDGLEAYIDWIKDWTELNDHE